ncbi:hypothetical protein EUZ85_18740 [Hahella sp. KA22]|uniref:hypothetical protein n=1 Tax=Hahella sp. KA22 TaxID=1628392 RepID=UPI000FDD0F12|nr:hypothetical protein [Hahella sp. KA22]AZZ92651.1 hypothetical protein ENC22_16165 [Hahella sp. KA22]QAY56024.1 hypothetical protein EUZ85_18740 [Hahella sp. KA22]
MGKKLIFEYQNLRNEVTKESVYTANDLTLARARWGLSKLNDDYLFKLKRDLGPPYISGPIVSEFQFKSWSQRAKQLNDLADIITQGLDQYRNGGFRPIDRGCRGGGLFYLPIDILWEYNNNFYHKRGGSGPYTFKIDGKEFLLTGSVTSDSGAALHHSLRGYLDYIVHLKGKLAG